MAKQILHATNKHFPAGSLVVLICGASWSWEDFYKNNRISEPGDTWDQVDRFLRRLHESDTTFELCQKCLDTIPPLVMLKSVPL